LHFIDGLREDIQYSISEVLFNIRIRVVFLLVWGLGTE
jgi:hypothetical protein